MSNERVIQAADLTFILGAIRTLDNSIGTVSGQVETVGNEVAQTRSDLSRLEEAFADFVASDLKAKQLSLAETRQVKIRQELETTFGYYAVVRRQATGILQASDISLVRQETLNSATEELMISAPGYWLAPALVALAAWLSDNRDLATRALAEAIRRDDEKASLFFALVARRAGRAEANRVWLDRYFGMQDPHKLDRQTTVMVDALANGVFAGDVSLQCNKRITSWIEELSQYPGFTENQRKQWSDALRSKMPNDSHAGTYSTLAKFSPTWPALDSSVNAMAMHAVVLAYLKAIFDGEIQPAASLLAAVDDLLNKLVSRFDDEELPLRRQEEMCKLIIEEDGDKKAAQQRYDLQHKTLDEVVDFTQLLTNAAMHPETSHVTRATQRFAIALSRNWIVDAHADVSAQSRMAVPQTVEIGIEDWKGNTANGENENELVQSLGTHLDKREEEALAAVKLGGMHYAAIVFGVILVLWSVSAGFVTLLMGAACLTWVFLAHRGLAKTKATLKAKFAALKAQSNEALRACMAEVVELRRDLARRDSVAEDLNAYLQDISPDQHVMTTHSATRRVLVNT